MYNELKSLKALLEILKGKEDQFTFVRYYEPKSNKGNLLWLANQANIELKDSKIVNYLLRGDHLPCTKTVFDKLPKLGFISSYNEVKEALEFIIKNYKKII